MAAGQIWNRYVRYIGAGAVATGGIITLVKSIPTMIESFKLGLAQISRRSRRAGGGSHGPRSVLHGAILWSCVAILAVLTFVPGILGYLDSIAARALAALSASPSSRSSSSP